VDTSALLRRVVKTSAAAADRVRPAARGVVILLYHGVGAGTGLEVDLPAELFEEQMGELAAEHRVVTLDEALHALGGEAAPLGDPVVVTFDDGTADFVDTALPILERHRVPATLYVATGYVERGCDFPGRGAMASWSALRDALATGLLTIGSHTDTHALLDRLPARDVEHELDRSRQLITDRLGVRADHFAYPKAVIGSAAAQAAVRARFRSAAVAGTRSNRYGRTDPYRLHRSPIQVADGLRWFRRKAAGGMALEGVLREALDRRRYAGHRT
jgi:peptidoglycan/xylan/chitin deacetylase (PgdA/CDA1 family)